MEQRLWFACCCSGLSKELSPLALGKILAQITLAGASFDVLSLLHLQESDLLTEKVATFQISVSDCGIEIQQLILPQQTNHFSTLVYNKHTCYLTISESN